MEPLYSNIFGNGEPLLVLHGFLGMSDNWKTLGNQYSKNGFEVHLIDQRNHGKSFWSESFNYEVMAQDVRDYMEYHKLQKSHVLGHSMGGKTAMQLACSFPNLVKKLIVADIAPKYYPPHHQPIVNALNKINLETLDSRKAVDEQLSLYLADMGIRQFLLKNLYWTGKGKLGFRFNLEVLSTKMEEIGENINPSDSYDGPSLFLRGEQSEYVSSMELPEIRRHFPNAQLETVENAGHWLHAENPKQFFIKSLTFLKP